MCSNMAHFPWRDKCDIEAVLSRLLVPTPLGPTKRRRQRESLVIANLAKTKRALRLALKADLLSVSAEVRSSLSDLLSQKLLTLPAIRDAKAVLTFLPLRHEPDLTDFARSLLQRGVTVCLPRMDWDAGVFHAAQVTSVDEGLEIRRYNVPEPPADAPTIDADSIDVVLAPALAFDRHGMRLGHGAGMYDRFLAQAGFRDVVFGAVQTKTARPTGCRFPKPIRPNHRPNHPHPSPLTKPSPRKASNKKRWCTRPRGTSTLTRSAR